MQDYGDKVVGAKTAFYRTHIKRTSSAHQTHMKRTQGCFRCVSYLCLKRGISVSIT
jgi:hypothetical protein